MFLECAIIISGFMFAFRMRDEFVHQQLLLTRGAMTKIGTAYFCAIIITLVISRSTVHVWMIVFVPQFIFFITMTTLRTQRRSGFRVNLANQLTRLILKMKSGRAFQSALAEVIDESDPQMRARLVEIRNLVVFSQHDATETPTWPLIRMIVDEFRAIDQTPHAALRRLQTFREKILVENDFRRKSGQVLRQIRAQALLLSGLYLAVFIFVCRQFGFAQHFQLMTSSLMLFFCGLSWIWLGGRRWKWKV